MIARFQPKGLARLFAILSLSFVLSTIFVGPRADAAQDGYGADVMTAWHNPSLVEGRSAVVAGR